MTIDHQMTTADSPQRTPEHRYRREPIVEAIMDVRIVPTADVTIHKLSLANAGLGHEYPKRVPTYRQRIQGGFSPENPEVTAEQSTIGFVFVSADDLQQYRVTAEGLTFNRLAPYVGWQTFRDEGRRLWSQFRAAVGDSVVVSRFGLRYINRIEIPTDDGNVELSQYFATVPNIAPDLPQLITGFFMRLEFDSPVATLAVVLAGTPPTKPGHVAVLLDLDMFKIVSSPMDDDELWSTIETLRTEKNRAFEACITDRLRELID
jgi:uncharacterized protein (TIGR04255 family)